MSPADKLSLLLPHLQPPQHDAGAQAEARGDGGDTEDDGGDDEDNGGDDEDDGGDDEDDGGAHEWPELREEEVNAALFSSCPFAAAGPDDIPNAFLQTLYPRLRHRLLPLASATLRLGHVPLLWRDAIGLVLRKHKKPDYAKPKAYRMISFVRCVAKVLEKVVARRLGYLSEEGRILAKNHVGGRRCRSVEDALACVDDLIWRQWRNGNVVVGGAAAFPSLRWEQLEKDLKKRGVPRPARRFISSFLQCRRITLKLDDALLDLPAHGLPQGSALSPLLYCVYNSDVIESLDTPNSTAYGWIDDVNAFAWGRTAGEAVRTLNARLPLLETWSRNHSSRFEPLKSAAVLFAPPGKHTPDPLPPVRLCGETVPFSSSLTMLSTELDAHLSYAPHVAACAARAQTALNGVKALLSAKTGVTMALGQQLVQGVVAPRMRYGGGVWWREGRSEGLAKLLRPVQRESARLDSRCVRTTLLEAMEVEAGLPPLELALAAAAATLALRALSCTPSHPLHRPTRLALAVPKPRSPPSALHHALASPLLPPVPNLEHIHPDPEAPWETAPPIRLSVAASKEEAAAEVQQLLDGLAEEDLMAFSDGSELEGGWTGTGLAVRLGADLWADRKETLGQYRGVYEAELFGIHLAISSILQLFPSPSTAATLHILADNVSALTLFLFFLSAPADPRPTAGQSTRLATLAAIRHARKARPQVSIQLTWVPGHAGIEGNKRADELAKEGAEDRREADERGEPLKAAAMPMSLSWAHSSPASRAATPPCLFISEPMSANSTPPATATVSPPTPPAHTARRSPKRDITSSATVPPTPPPAMPSLAHSTPAPSHPFPSSLQHPPLHLLSSNSSSAAVASRGFTSPSQQHPAPPPAPQDDARPRCEAQPGAQADGAMDTDWEGESGAARASSGRSRYGPGEGFDVDKFSAPGELGSVAVAAAAGEAAVLDLTTSNEETDKEGVGWAVWHEALEEVVGEETPAARAWCEADEQITLPLARQRYAAAAAIIVSLKRARRHARDWCDYPESDAQEARGHAAFAIYNILADALLAIRATALEAVHAGFKASKEKTGSEGILIHTSGTGIFATGDKRSLAPGPESKVYSDKDIAAIEALGNAHPQRKVHIRIIDAAEKGYVRSYIVLPLTIFGISSLSGVSTIFNKHRLQIPLLIRSSLRKKQAGLVGEYKCTWPLVHTDDLTALYEAIFDAALKKEDAGNNRQGFYAAENGQYVGLEVVNKRSTAHLTASDTETGKEEVGWEVWWEVLEEIVGKETPAGCAWREGDEQVTLPLARFRYAAATADVVSLKRACLRTRDWRDCPKSDAQEACGYAAFVIYDILADTLLALCAAARDEARYERTSQHRRRKQHRQTPPPPP
ncbi:hypothetical protein JCM8097_008588 [Rhodosporidiobolus ruineniae]